MMYNFLISNEHNDYSQKQPQYFTKIHVSTIL